MAFKGTGGTMTLTSASGESITLKVSAMSCDLTVEPAPPPVTKVFRDQTFEITMEAANTWFDEEFFKALFWSAEAEWDLSLCASLALHGYDYTQENQQTEVI